MRTPTGCCGSTSRKARISPATSATGIRWRTRLMAGPVLSFNSGHQQKCSQSCSSLIIPRITSAQLLPPVETSGIISPLLMNVALHGLETAAGVRYYPASSSKAGCAEPGSPMVIRYADDLVALCHSQRQAEQVKAGIAEWLTPRGLTFNEEKTRIVHIDDGYDFLGFNVRRYNGKLLIKPSKA